MGQILYDEIKLHLVRQLADIFLNAVSIISFLHPIISETALNSEAPFDSEASTFIETNLLKETPNLRFTIIEAA